MEFYAPQLILLINGGCVEDYAGPKAMLACC